MDKNLDTRSYLGNTRNLSLPRRPWAKRTGEQFRVVSKSIHNAHSRYPVLVVDDANHGQVASGEIPSFVTEADIPSPITFEEAHTRYQESY